MDVADEMIDHLQIVQGDDDDVVYYMIYFVFHWLELFYFEDMVDDDLVMVVVVLLIDFYMKLIGIVAVKCVYVIHLVVI